MADDYESLEQLRRDLETWSLEQDLEVAAEVYDPRRPDIHELSDEDLVDRFRTLLGFDVSWDPPPTTPPEAPPDEEG